MGYNLNIDTDIEGALQLAMQGQQIPSWVYENSQIAHENKRIRLVALQLEAVEEAQQKQRGQLQKQEKESKNNQSNKHQRHQAKKQKDDLLFE